MNTMTLRTITFVCILFIFLPHFTFSQEHFPALLNAESFTRQRTRSPFALTLQPLHTTLTGLHRDTRYYIDCYSSDGTSTLTPKDDGEAMTGSLGVVIQGGHYSTVIVEIEAMPYIVSDRGDEMSMTYSTVVHVEANKRYSYSDADTFKLDANGICNLRFGYNFKVPENFPDSATFTGQLLCNVRYKGSAVYKTAMANLTIGINGIPLSMFPAEGVADNIKPQTSYAVSYYPGPGKSYIFPQENNEQINKELGITIFGKPNTVIGLKFFLPETLRASGSKLMQITFPSTTVSRAAHVETKTYFDPHIVKKLFLSDSGTCSIRLGYTFTAPPQPGSYVGYIRCKSYYSTWPGSKNDAAFSSRVDTNTKDIKLTIISNNVADVVPDGNLPNEFLLEQNYPNPFNPLTVIRYSLSERSQVQLSVYNILGNEVARLVDGVQEAGFKTQEWDATGFPSGIYYYKLVSENFNSVKTMVLIR